MRSLIFAALIFSTGSTFGQYQRQQFDAPYGTQGRPIQIEIDTTGTIMSVHAEQAEVTAGYNCPDGFVAPAEHSIVNPGTLGGAVIGGLSANHIGGGRGKTAATVAGTVVGGIVGNEVYKRLNDPDDVRTRNGRINGECYEVKKVVPVYVYRIAIRGLNLSGGDRPPLIEQTNVRAFTKFAIGQQVPAKIQINYFVNRLD